MQTVLLMPQKDKMEMENQNKFYHKMTKSPKNNVTNCIPEKTKHISFSIIVLPLKVQFIITYIYLKPVPHMVSAVPFLAPHKKSTIFV